MQILYEYGLEKSLLSCIQLFECLFGALQDLLRAIHDNQHCNEYDKVILLLAHVDIAVHGFADSRLLMIHERR